MFISHYNGHGIKLVRPLSTVDNTCDYARVSHSRQWSNYNIIAEVTCVIYRYSYFFGAPCRNVSLVCLCIALLIIAGVGIAESDYTHVYRATLEAIGAILAVISAIFIILVLVGGSKTSPA